MLYTTFRLAHEAGACLDSYRKFAKAVGGITKYGRDTPIPLSQICEINGLSDALWCLRATTTNSDRFARLLACDYAEHVLPLFEQEYPEDKRLRRAIETARRFANREATEVELSAAEVELSAAEITAWAKSLLAKATWNPIWDAAWNASKSLFAKVASNTTWDAAWNAAISINGERRWQTKRFLDFIQEGGN